mmetsp:Transcript_7019/g.14232  ORF Transcript_7019/g.14232 Transcript_7019/m.14232 type:complete len:226 (-) Transcript_7019:3377-4054(-)
MFSTPRLPSSVPSLHLLCRLLLLLLIFFLFLLPITLLSSSVLLTLGDADILLDQRPFVALGDFDGVGDLGVGGTEEPLHLLSNPPLVPYCSLRISPFRPHLPRTPKCVQPIKHTPPLPSRNRTLNDPKSVAVHGVNETSDLNNVTRVVLVPVTSTHVTSTYSCGQEGSRVVVYTLVGRELRDRLAGHASLVVIPPEHCARDAKVLGHVLERRRRLPGKGKQCVYM